MKKETRTNPSGEIRLKMIGEMEIEGRKLFVIDGDPQMFIKKIKEKIASLADDVTIIESSIEDMKDTLNARLAESSKFIEELKRTIKEASTELSAVEDESLKPVTRQPQGRKEVVSGQGSQDGAKRKYIRRNAIGGLNILDHMVLATADAPEGLKLKEMFKAVTDGGVDAKKTTLSVYLSPKLNKGYFLRLKGGIRKLTAKGIARAKELKSMPAGNASAPPEESSERKTGDEDEDRIPHGPPHQTFVRRESLQASSWKKNRLYIKADDKSNKSEFRDFNGRAIETPDTLDQEIAAKLKKEDLVGKPCLWKIGAKFFPWNGTGQPPPLVRVFYNNTGEFPPRIAMPDYPAMFRVEVNRRNRILLSENYM